MENFFNYSVQTRVFLIENNIQPSETIDILSQNTETSHYEESPACSINTYIIRKTYEKEYEKYCNVNDEFKKSFFRNIINTKDDNY